MKTNNFIINFLLFVLICFGTSCNDVNLNLESTKPNYNGKGEEPIIRGQLVVAYNLLLNQNLFGENYWGSLNGVDTDEAYRENVTNNISILNGHNITPDANQLRDLWKYIWQGNEAAIDVISMLKTVDGMSEIEKNHVQGQAMVLTAFYHFFAAVNFGPVPIKSTPTFDMGTTVDIGRYPVKDVCQYALNQCRAAIPLLKPMTSLNTTAQISKSAAEALSYRIALYMASHQDIKDVAKYDSVVVWADNFIATGPNKLNTQSISINGESVPAYARLFVKNMQNDQRWDASTDPEGIWDVIFYCKSTTSGVYANLGYQANMSLGSYMGVPCADDQPNSKIGYADLTYRALNNLNNKYIGINYPVGDLRRDWNIPTFCYKYKENDQKATGMLGTTRFPYFQVIFPAGITNTTPATFIPVLDQTGWSASSASLKNVLLEQGGAGYKDATGASTFTVTINAIPTTPVSATTMGDFNAAKGGIIGYKSGTSLNKTVGLNYGYQTIQAKNTTGGVIISVVGGVVTSITSTYTGTNTTLGSGFAMVTERGIGKWRREYEVNVPPARDKYKSSSNFPLLRFADVLLMASEAHLNATVKGNPTKGLEYLNMVRRRAYNKDISSVNVQVDFLLSNFNKQTIMDERSRELCFEGTRRFDLIRWGAYQGAGNVVDQVVAQNPNDQTISYPIVRLSQDYVKYNILPIPQDEISFAPNSMYQNPGW